MIAVAKATLLGPVYDLQPGKTKSDKAMLTFSVKTWRPQGEGREDKKNWFRVVAYDGAARVLSEHLRDGKILYLDGKLDMYRDKEGIERLQIILETFSFVGDQ
jgi:YD repeat-containing protein